jgi:hypothetical protein
MNTWRQRVGSEGSDEPQRVQNCRMLPGEEVNCPIRSVPESQRNPLDAAAADRGVVGVGEMRRCEPALPPGLGGGTLRHRIAGAGVAPAFGTSVRLMTMAIAGHGWPEGAGLPAGGRELRSGRTEGKGNRPLYR